MVVEPLGRAVVEWQPYLPAELIGADVHRLAARHGGVQLLDQRGRQRRARLDRIDDHIFGMPVGADLIEDGLLKTSGLVGVETVADDGLGDAGRHVVEPFDDAGLHGGTPPLAVEGSTDTIGREGLAKIAEAAVDPASIVHRTGTRGRVEVLDEAVHVEHRNADGAQDVDGSPGVAPVGARGASRVRHIGRARGTRVVAR